MSDELYLGLRTILASQVGDSLTQVSFGEDDETGPAIYRGRQNQYKTYPYITMDILSTKADGGWVEDIYVNDQDLTTYVFNYQTLFLITCFGAGAQSILTEFKKSLSFSTTRIAFKNAAGGLAEINRSKDVRESQNFLDTDYEEQASMQLTVNHKSVTVDTTSGVIETVELESNIEDETSNVTTKTFTLP